MTAAARQRRPMTATAAKAAPGQQDGAEPLALEIPTAALAARERQRRYAERQRSGLVVVPVTVEEVRLIEALLDIGSVPSEPTRAELAIALSQIVDELLTRHERARWGD